MGEQRAWAIRVTVLANEAEIDSVVDRIGKAICPDLAHSGSCPIPWEITSSPVDDLDADERAHWQPGVDSLREQRRLEQPGSAAHR
ncbi:hypothetical protein [Krasilnikovia sp. MM14-A1259]|uniref:hypothetical protein n=1 Tax=Krasilnikovia sp. MM14-A1259 TaxID=3373539 RepID=UPI00382B5942